jgi:hypothetical protein
VDDLAGWRRPLFVGVHDFPKGLVGVDGSSQSACGTARSRKACPRQSLAERGSLREIAPTRRGASRPNGGRQARGGSLRPARTSRAEAPSPACPCWAALLPNLPPFLLSLKEVYHLSISGLASVV